LLLLLLLCCAGGAVALRLRTLPSDHQPDAAAVAARSRRWRWRFAWRAWWLWSLVMVNVMRQRFCTDIDKQTRACGAWSNSKSSHSYSAQAGPATHHKQSHHHTSTLTPGGSGIASVVRSAAARVIWAQRRVSPACAKSGARPPLRGASTPDLVRTVCAEGTAHRVSSNGHGRPARRHTNAGPAAAPRGSGSGSARRRGSGAAT
jgi:hypothetical protein